MTRVPRSGGCFPTPMPAEFFIAQIADASGNLCVFTI
jgi:hypothetical protein